MLFLTPIYRLMVNTGERILPARVKTFIKWNHPAGPKTIHFWAPFAKWSLVIAGASDLARPAQKLSKNQSISLAATGLIWSRYSMVIIPKNWMLFAVNIFLGAVGLHQLIRIYMYEQEKKKQEMEKSIESK
jgi:mitochondrial pyruvate carrier 2